LACILGNKASQLKKLRWVVSLAFYLQLFIIQ
jgi:hypothetical protein